ncbi:MAG: hypothetical protein ACOY93_05455 [Bacillota bacterium]
MDLVQRVVRWGGVLFLLLILWNVLTMRPATRQLWSYMWGRLVNEGAFGVGYWDGEYNEFDFSQLEPGDLVLGGNTGSSWGHWTHAAIYIGDGMVMDNFLRTGVAPRPVTAYNEYYSHAGALRVKLPPAVKQEAVARAKSLAGRPFHLLAPRNSRALYYCSKIAWWAYASQGYDLDPDGAFWVVPDRMATSGYVEPVQPKGVK